MTDAGNDVRNHRIEPYHPQDPLPQEPFHYEEVMGRALRLDHRTFGLLTEGELAQTLGLQTLTLAKWRRDAASSGQAGPAYVRLGKSIFYRTKDVYDWFDRNTHFPALPEVEEAALEAALEAAA